MCKIVTDVTGACEDSLASAINCRRTRESNILGWLGEEAQEVDRAHRQDEKDLDEKSCDGQLVSIRQVDWAQLKMFCL